MKALRFVYSFYILILIAVPVLAAVEYFREAAHWEELVRQAELNGEEPSLDCEGLSSLIHIVLGIISALFITISLVMMLKIKKSPGWKKASMITAIVMAVIPVAPYLWMLFLFFVSDEAGRIP
jgi:uncharacterized membrane protein